MVGLLQVLIIFRSPDIFGFRAAPVIPPTAQAVLRLGWWLVAQPPLFDRAAALLAEPGSRYSFPKPDVLCSLFCGHSTQMPGTCQSHSAAPLPNNQTL
jgi:hypothetical protein